MENVLAIAGAAKTAQGRPLAPVQILSTTVTQRKI
jgi:hypothetical protein